MKDEFFKSPIYLNRGKNLNAKHNNQFIGFGGEAKARYCSQSQQYTCQSIQALSTYVSIMKINLNRGSVYLLCAISVSWRASAPSGSRQGNTANEMERPVSAVL